MASIPPVDGKECISKEIQLQILTPSHPLNTHSSHDDTSVEVKDNTNPCEEWDSVEFEFNLHGHNNRESCGRRAFEKVTNCLVSSWDRLVEKTYSRYLTYCLLFIISYPLHLPVIVVAVPVLLVGNIVLRILQIFAIRTHRQYYMARFRFSIISLCVVVLIFFQLSILSLVAAHEPRFKLVIIAGLPIIKWIPLIFNLMAIYSISKVVWFVIRTIIMAMVQSESAFLVIESVSEIIGCLLFRCAVTIVTNSVPLFKHSKILDVYTNKWIEVFLYLLIGYNIISWLTGLVMWSLHKVFSRSYLLCSQPRYLVYVAFNIELSIIFISSSLMFLLSWVLYFNDPLNSTSRGKWVFKFGTRSLVSILICSFLCLIKSILLSYWKIYFIYNKLHSKIPDLGRYLYFFVLLSRTHYKSVRYNLRPIRSKEPWVLWFGDQYRTHDDFRIWDRKRIRNTLLRDSDALTWPISDLDDAAWLFLYVRHWLWDTDSLNFIHLHSHCSVESANVIETLKKIILVTDDSKWEKDWERLLGLLGVNQSTKRISFQQVKKWMECAHAKCSSLTNVLSGEEEAAKCLNNVLRVLIIGVTFIIWLLISELTTTKVLVLVATPLVAASFVIGDTCKTLFQGLVFIYIFHPFNVGDHCIIDEKQLEVKRIGVWNCIFSYVHASSKDQDIVYANSELATKKFIKCKTEIDWSDYLEFSSSFLNDRIISLIKEDLKSYFIPGITTTLNSVEFRDTGDHYKVAISVKYTEVEGDLSYHEFLQEKEKLRSKLSIDIKSLLRDCEHRYKKSSEQEQDQQ